MASKDYHFISHWRVRGTVQDVVDIIGDAEDLPRWWPSVYLNVQVLEKGDKNGLGKVVDLYTKGWLPYTLRWQFRVTDIRDDGFSLLAQGGFEGRGIWIFKQDGSWVDITYDWKISAEKPLLRYFSFLMKPIFAANHRWAMARGEESLALELARLHPQTSQVSIDPIQLLPVPKPIKIPLALSIPIVTVAIVLVSGLAYVFLRSRRAGAKSQQKE